MSCDITFSVLIINIIAGIITKKEGKTKVLEANAESEEDRTDWITSIKSVFKDPLSPRFSASSSNGKSPADKNKAEGMPEKTAEKEKDCQCIIA